MAVSAPPDAAGVLPPQNLEAETAVLGAILIAEETLDGVLLDVRLRPDDFYRPRHQLIFRSMVRLTEKAEPEAVDVVTVCEDLRRSGDLEEAGGEAYVHSLPTVVPAVGNAPHYARIVKSHALLRRLLEATRQVQDRVYSHSGEAHELVDEAEAILFRIGHEDRSGDLRSIEDVLHDEIDKLERVSREGVHVTGTPSGFKDIDDLTGGFQPGNLIVLAARPAMGKSALVTNIAENAAVDHGHPVALFSLEMSETELAQRFIASQAKLNGDDLRKGRVKPDRWPKVVKATEKLAGSPLFVDDSSDLGLLELRAKARRLHGRQKLGLLVVDYLQLMRPQDSTVNRVEQIAHISRGLKILARELHIPVIAVSQLSRAVEARPDKRPLLSDLRESGCLTGDSLVYLPETGAYRPISQLVGAPDFDVLALNPESWRLERRRALRAFPTGRRPVYRLTTALGRRIRATGNHQFLTVQGWERLDRLEAGGHIALPRELPGPPIATMRQEERASAMQASGVMAGEMQAGIGTQSSGSTLYKTNLGRERASRVASVVSSPELARLAAGDVYWDKVVSTEADGEEEVYDLTVDGLHNFVANDIVVHNSIEQDSDLVMFIYRDEYYTKERSETPGEAELIIAKHRNGPIGRVDLAFLSRHPKFATLYRERLTPATPGDNGNF